MMESFGTARLSLQNNSSESKHHCCSKVVKQDSIKASGAGELGLTLRSNDGHDEETQETNGCDIQNHERKACDHKRANCKMCGEIMSCSTENTCRDTEIRELRIDLAKFRTYVQDEVSAALRKLASAIQKIEGNLTQPNGNSPSEAQSRAEIVVAGGEGIKSTIILNVASEKWRCLAATYECEGASSVKNNDNMLVTGGSVGHLTDAVTQLDLSQHNAQWVESQIRLPFLCQGHQTVLYQNSLIVIGGLIDCQEMAVDTIHGVPLTPPYKPELLCKLSQPKCLHGVELVNDRLYVLGGCRRYANTATDDVIEYDPARKTCIQLKSLPYSVSGMATACWQDKVLVIGGLDRKGNYLDTVIMYDVNTQRHHILPKMQKKRAYCTTVVVGDKLIVMGGADERSSRVSSVERYDFQTYTWRDLAPMDEPRAYATAVVNYF